MAALIIALDYQDKKNALELVDVLSPRDCALKVGNEMFTRFGPAFIRELTDRQFRIFLDLKFHDIPNTVAQACAAAADLGVWMTNIHAAGGLPMMEAARNALEPFGKDAPLLMAVTVLTSMSPAILKTLGCVNNLDEQVLHLAKLAGQAHLDGVVCAAFEVQALKKNCGQDFLTVTPGIRLDKAQADDQVRVMTPVEAARAGSDFLVIGRPVTAALHPEKVVEEILASI